jgi:hypothetical protein
MRRANPYIHPATNALRERQLEREAQDEADAAEVMSNIVGLPMCHVCGREHETEDHPTPAQPEPAMHPITTQEQQARLAKATKIADVIEAHPDKIRLEDVATLTTDQWVLLASAARTNVPSSKTRALVIQLLMERAAAKHSHLLTDGKVLSGEKE